MKILIVDDEVLTREGIIRHIPWDMLGITDIFQAEDGEEGISVSAKKEPDIIMTDIRMPRMDGITMAFQIRKSNPKCQFIFVSGYCDKEYLKSAIQLSAVNYIEKPVEIEEMISALKMAVRRVKEERKRERLEQEYRKRFTGVLEEIPEEDLIPASWHSSMDTADRIEQYIQDHFDNPELSLTLLEEQFSLSKQYMCWLFKKEKNRTINQCIINRRIEWAKRYMYCNPGVKVKDVAAKAGFSDSNYFIRIFKKHECMTPADFLHSRGMK